MKTFSNDAKNIKITFVCSACNEDVPMDTIAVPASCELVINAVCPICFNDFEVKIFRNAEKSWVEIADVSASNITIEEI